MEQEGTGTQGQNRSDTLAKRQEDKIVRENRQREDMKSKT